MKRKGMLLCRGLFVLLLTAACCTLAVAAEKKAVKKQMHPKLSEQEKNISCDQCHEEVTPELRKEWYDSRHGIAMVKCYQCHGTFETFRVTPTRQDCAACHENMMNKCPKDKVCWQCHIPHTFKEKG